MNIPAPITKYLESYPMFNLEDDIGGSYVRTSMESFYYAVKLIYESLNHHEVIWTTDNISLSPNFAKYWVEEGLSYLQIIHEATTKGIKVNRVFIVSDFEFTNFKSELEQLGNLHAKAGVNPLIAIYERLPLQCRYDFAILGNTFVDEVVYDIKSNNVIDNYIHWSPMKIRHFNQKMDIIRNFVEPNWRFNTSRENFFDDVLKYAKEIRRQIEILPNQSKEKKQSKKKKNKIKILLLSSNPTNTTKLRLDEEFREIEHALQQTEFRSKFIVEKHLAVRVSDLQGYLLKYKPDIVHFSGHGSSNSEIILENLDGVSQPITGRALSQLFFVLKDNVKCVVLNACYSESQANAISENISCVIGMSKAIGDKPAIKFATAFYQALGYGRNVKTAFDLGCVLIDLENLGEHNIPKLISKLNPESISFFS